MRIVKQPVNTLAAIAVSQQPGKFEYHKSSAEVKELEETKVLNKLARAVEKVGRELEQIDTEIHSATPKKTTPEEPSLGSLSSWFDMYGRPEGINAKDMISTFEPAGKIFGGTAHHRSFKSQTSALKKGRITRQSNKRDDIVFFVYDLMTFFYQITILIYNFTKMQ